MMNFKASSWSEADREESCTLEVLEEVSHIPSMVFFLEHHSRSL